METRNHSPNGATPKSQTSRTILKQKIMKTILTVCLFLTVFGAMNAVLNGTVGKDIIQMVMGNERTIGTDFLRILIGLSAITTLVWGLKKLYSNKA